MRRMIYDEGPDGERRLDGWFEDSKARVWTRDQDIVDAPAEWRELVRTAGGQWLIGHRTRVRGRSDRYERAEPEQAMAWLSAEGRAEDLETYFGGPEERRGRPSQGPRVDLRLPEALLAQVDAYAEEREWSRSEALRDLISAGLRLTR